jgi:hypothetical protein
VTCDLIKRAQRGHGIGLGVDEGHRDQHRYALAMRRERGPGPLGRRRVAAMVNARAMMVA